MRQRLRTAAAVCGSAVLLVTALLSGGTATAAPVPERPDTPAAAVSPTVQKFDTRAVYQRVRNFGTHLCLAVPGGSLEEGKQLIQWPCGPWNDHYWAFENAFTSGGLQYVRIRNLNSGQCLAVPGGSTAAGTTVIQWPCGTWRDHYWGLRVSSSGTQLVNYNSGQCLGIPGNDPNAGVRVFQWPCGPWPDHYWFPA
ncbi:RICIN domain-containing protein [Streptomyces sp. NPDC000594]|uniref:RICIN domain-containing protein n=1 Tax=Streptomyces sp. NPDC000594 TaxID=3154261 RepID=UPI0033270BD2